MRLTIAVDLGNGVETVDISPMAIVGYEVDNRTKISRLASDGIGVGDMSDLAWRQLTLEGRTDLDLDTFRRELRDIDPVAADDPT